MSQLEAIRQRVAAATPGPWNWDSDYLRQGISKESGHIVMHVELGGTEMDPEAQLVILTKDADLIVNAPADLAYLLGEVKIERQARIDAHEERDHVAKLLEGAQAELARRDAIREKATSLILDGPFTFDASSDIPTLKGALTEAKGIFDRQVKLGALPHSDWTRMAEIASGNITRALHGRERTPQVFEEGGAFGDKTPAPKCPVCDDTGTGSNGMPCARIH